MSVARQSLLEHAHTQKHCAPARRLFEGAEWLAPVSEAIFKGCQWRVRTVSSGAYSSGGSADAQPCITFEAQVQAGSRALSLVHKSGSAGRSRRERAGGTEQVADLGLHAKLALTYSPKPCSALGGENRALNHSNTYIEIAHYRLENHC